MKIKSIILATIVALISATAVFAKDSDIKTLPSPVSKVEASKEILTYTVKVSVSKKGDYSFISLKTEDGTFIADVDETNPAAADILSYLKIRKNKKAIVSGTLNKMTGIFTVEKIGGDDLKIAEEK